MKPNLSSIVLCAALLVLAGCESVTNAFKGDNATVGETPGTREAILEGFDQVKPDTRLSANAIALPTQVDDAEWNAAGGSPANVPGHPAVPAVIKEAWSADIGVGSSAARKLTARPVTSNGRVFTMDSEGKVSAHSMDNGAALWEAATEPADVDEESFGGGLALDGNKLFATNGYGIVTCLSVSDGKVLWSKPLGHPFRNAPVAADGRVIVVGINNETHALSQDDGKVLWRHAGISESTSLLGSASAAVTGETVIVTYSSGEIFAIRAPNGRVVWGDLLAVPTQVGALPAMADIRGMPVADRGGVFAVSYSGPMTAISMRSGERAWDLDVGSANTPLLAGNVVYLLTNRQILLAITMQTGRVVWSQQLASLKDPKEPDSDPIVWSGPVLAGGRLLLTNSMEQLVEISPKTGEIITTHELSAPSYIAPTVAAGTVFAVTERGKLQAFR